MNKEELVNLLKNNYIEFIMYIDSLSSIDFEQSMHNKWSPAEQLNHIYLSVKPFANGLKKAPKFILKTSFGITKNGSKSYNEIIAYYNSFLDNGGKAPDKYIPKFIPYDLKKELINKLTHQLNKLMQAINTYSEEELDKY